MNAVAAGKFALCRFQIGDRDFAVGIDAVPQFLHPAFMDVKAGHAHVFRERERQRHADIAQPDQADMRGFEVVSHSIIYIIALIPWLSYSTDMAELKGFDRRHDVFRAFAPGIAGKQVFAGGGGNLPGLTGVRANMAQGQSPFIGVFRVTEIGVFAVF